MEKLKNSLAFIALVVIYYTIRIYYLPNPFRTVYAFRAWRQYDSAPAGSENPDIRGELITLYRDKFLVLAAQAISISLFALVLPWWGALLIVLVLTELLLYVFRKFATAIDEIDESNSEPYSD